MFALSLMSVMAVLAYSTAFLVSPPRLWLSDAANDVESSMYLLADIPAVL